MPPCRSRPSNVGGPTDRALFLPAGGHKLRQFLELQSLRLPAGNAPSHEVLAVIETRVIQILPIRARALSTHSSLEYVRVLYSLIV